MLKDRNLAQIVADSLLHFDGVHVEETHRDSPRLPTTEIRYHISDFIVMPNHVHVLVCFLPGVSLLAQCDSWKHFTAAKINRELKKSGEFWQPESFDHLVRDGDHFWRFRKYIAENPKKARLKTGEYIHYQCRD